MCEFERSRQQVASLSTAVKPASRAEPQASILKLRKSTQAICSLAALRAAWACRSRFCQPSPDPTLACECKTHSSRRASRPPPPPPSNGAPCVPPIARQPDEQPCKRGGGRCRSARALPAHAARATRLARPLHWPTSHGVCRVRTASRDRRAEWGRAPDADCRHAHRMGIAYRVTTVCRVA